MCVAWGRLASASTRNVATMNVPATIDAHPTRTAPRRLIAVAPQITASATSHFAVPASDGKKKRRYWLKTMGYSAMSTSEYIQVIQPF